MEIWREYFSELDPCRSMWLLHPGACAEPCLFMFGVKYACTKCYLRKVLSIMAGLYFWDEFTFPGLREVNMHNNCCFIAISYHVPPCFDFELRGNGWLFHLKTTISSARLFSVVTETKLPSLVDHAIFLSILPNKDNFGCCMFTLAVNMISFLSALSCWLRSSVRLIKGFLSLHPWFSVFQSTNLSKWFCHHITIGFSSFLIVVISPSLRTGYPYSLLIPFIFLIIDQSWVIFVCLPTKLQHFLHKSRFNLKKKNQISNYIVTFHTV